MTGEEIPVSMVALHASAFGDPPDRSTDRRAASMSIPPFVNMTIPVPRRRILCVDDNFTVRKLVATILEKEDHAVVCADDGHHALQLILETPEPFEILVTDHHMPKLSGMQLVAALKISGTHLAIIVLSGNLHSSEITQYQKLGVWKVLEKPFVPQNILDAVNSASLALERPESPGI